MRTRERTTAACQPGDVMAVDLARWIRAGMTVREIERLLRVKAIHRAKGRHLTDEEIRAL